MANAVYPKAREAFAGGKVAWDTDDIAVLFCTSGYVYDPTDEFLDIIGLGNRVATTPPLTGKTLTNGVLDADDVSAPSVPGGSTIARVVVYQDTGVESTSRLLVYFDTQADTTPITLVTNGGDVIMTWSNGTNKIAVI